MRKFRPSVWQLTVVSKSIAVLIWEIHYARLCLKKKKGLSPLGIEALSNYVAGTFCKKLVNLSNCSIELLMPCCKTIS